MRLASEQKAAEAEEVLPAVFAGSPELSARLKSMLSRDAAPGALAKRDSVGHASILFFSLDGDPGEDDLECLRDAGKARVPVICLRAGTGRGPLPGVLATSIVSVSADGELPIAQIGHLVCRLLDGRSVALAASLPALRPSICGELIHRSARRSAFVGATSFIPAPDLPALFLEQARLILRLGQAHGRRLEPARAGELAAVLAAGLTMRRLARRTRSSRIPGWAVQGSIAYAGTLALGEAALLYFAAAHGDSDSGAETPIEASQPPEMPSAA